MAKVLFFLQVLIALVVLPFWPGLSPVYAGWGLLYLALVVTIAFATALAVHGAPATGRALADVWSPVLLGPGARTSVQVWTLVARSFPLAGVLGGLVALAGALQSFTPDQPISAQILVLGLFCLIWGFLGLLLGRILHQVVVGLSARPILPVLVLTPECGTRFGLTPREAEAAQAVLDGLTYRGASEKMGIEPATVKSHVLSVYQKTGAGNKIELLRLVEAETGRLHQKVDGPDRAPGRS